MATSIVAAMRLGWPLLFRTSYKPGWEYGGGFLTVFEEKFEDDFYPPIDLAIGNKQKWSIIWHHVGPGDGSGPQIVGGRAYFRAIVETARKQFQSKLFMAKNDGVVYDVSDLFYPPGISDPQVWFGRDSIDFSYYIPPIDPHRLRGRTITNSIPYGSLNGSALLNEKQYRPESDGHNHWMAPQR
ncbi:MAG TPA: hypothetical protein VMF06_23955 [Candidatus Limnocylindria bacterium]|nr:hypothetical protein [Candidatus Limnocylindria bacterium]